MQYYQPGYTDVSSVIKWRLIDRLIESVITPPNLRNQLPGCTCTCMGIHYLWISYCTASENL